MEQVIEQIYDAALDSGEWKDVTESLSNIFISQTSALYSLNLEENFYYSFNTWGVTDSFFSQFRTLFFTEDNPWLLSEPLHQPGVIRTDCHLSQYFNDKKVLQKSTYYNEWLKPQNLNHSIGCTLAVNNVVRTHLSLFRSSEEGKYSKADISQFSTICRHAFRALRTAKRLESLNLTVQLADKTMQQLSDAAFVLNTFSEVININNQGEALLKQQNFLSIIDNQMSLDNKTLDIQLKQYICSGIYSVDEMNEFLFKSEKDNVLFSISLIDLYKQPSPFISSKSTPAKLLLIKEKPVDFKFKVKKYDFTPSETKLAKCLCSGLSLKQSAKASNISYETARSYLKIMFQKTQTHRQIDLVRLIMDDN